MKILLKLKTIIIYDINLFINIYLIEKLLKILKNEYKFYF